MEICRYQTEGMITWGCRCETLIVIDLYGKRKAVLSQQHEQQLHISLNLEWIIIYNSLIEPNAQHAMPLWINRQHLDISRCVIYIAAFNETVWETQTFRQETICFGNRIAKPKWTCPVRQYTVNTDED